MKKLILIGLIAIGVSVASVPAQAGGFSVGVVVSPLRLPVLLPPPPIFVPAVVVPAGCARPVVVRGGDCGPYFRPGGFGWSGHRVFVRRDAHFGHDRR
jgi:hypothetical protein